jgi:hypothetical protein
MLLGETPQSADRSVLLTFVVPAAAWAALVALLALMARHSISLRAGRQRHGRRAARSWKRRLLPGAAFLLVGAGLLAAAPLATARHFYPDTGWALTLIAYLATAWGVARLLLAARTLRPAASASAATTRPNGTVRAGNAGSRNPEAVAHKGGRR